MVRRLIVLGRVLVVRAIATAYVAACEAEAGLDPRVSETQALFASGRRIREMIGCRAKVFAGFLVGHRATLSVALREDRVGRVGGNVAQHTEGTVTSRGA
jgi:hypothetical protein